MARQGPGEPVIRVFRGNIAGQTMTSPLLLASVQKLQARQIRHSEPLMRRPRKAYVGENFAQPSAYLSIGHAGTGVDSNALLVFSIFQKRG
jgi:hypothetical protein